MILAAYCNLSRIYQVPGTRFLPSPPAFNPCVSLQEFSRLAKAVCPAIIIRWRTLDMQMVQNLWSLYLITP